MRLSQVMQRSRPVPIAMGDDTLNVVYNPAAYTPNFESEIKGMIDDGNSTGLAVIVNQVISDWDFYEDAPEGEQPRKVELDVDRLKALPIEFLSDVINGVMGDQRPNETSSAPSGSF